MQPDGYEQEIEYDRLRAGFAWQPVERMALKIHSNQTQPHGAPLLTHLYAVSAIAAKHAYAHFNDKDFYQQTYRTLVAKAAGMLHESIEHGGRYEEITEAADESTAKTIAAVTADMRMARPSRLKMYGNRVGLGDEVAQIIKLADLQHDAYQLLQLTSTNCMRPKVLKALEEWVEEAMMVLPCLHKLKDSLPLKEPLAELRRNVTVLDKRRRQPGVSA
jgi:hypothetical protein